METFETSSQRIARNDHVSIDIESPYSPLVNSVTSELEALPLLSDQCCIYRVPKRIRLLDEKIYTPQLVSIGPLHHGRDELKPMEEHKRRYLKDFLQRTEVGLDYFVLFIKKREEKLRNCYAEASRLVSDDFVKMILVDATFIIQVLLRYSYPRFVSSNDPFFTKSRMIKHIRSDIWLLENQLPFFILEELFGLAKIAMPSNHDESPSIIKLVHKFAENYMPHFDIPEGLSEIIPSPVEHFVDFLRICHQPLKSCSRNKIENLTTPSLTKLQQAGVKFKLGSSKNMFEITFNNGILEFPKLFVNPDKEFLFGNLLAFEDCHGENNYIADYISIMNYLVNSPKDVEILVQNEILDNWEENSEKVSTVFQKLVINTSIAPTNFYFAGLVEDLNAYCRSPWHKWKATLKQDYLSTPWAIISIIGAVILLVLTFIQAVCSIISV